MPQPSDKRPVTDVPYVLDSNARRLLYLLACAEAQCEDRAPLMVRGRPTEDWERVGEAQGGGGGGGGMPGLLSSCQTQCADLSIICKRAHARIVEVLEEEAEAYFLAKMPMYP